MSFIEVGGNIIDIDKVESVTEITEPRSRHYQFKAVMSFGEDVFVKCNFKDYDRAVKSRDNLIKLITEVPVIKVEPKVEKLAPKKTPKKKNTKKGK